MNNSTSNYPYSMQVQQASRTLTPGIAAQDASLLWNAIKTGAMVGATGATAMGLHQMLAQQTTRNEVARNILKTAATVGIATGAATAVGAVLKKQPALALIATFATGTAVMYALNKPELKEIKTNE